ncbi:GGDEF domain family protein [Photobacterium aphoticum]|uniref:GGDEF domain family protein n=1 Tax=Photobacterium aphoticum TaxID=754436 RepID=A0A090RJH7_9GAMM|nr:GGDEF domain family protein [Photobacterium aphoticum]
MTSELAGLTQTLKTGLADNTNLNAWRPTLTDLTRELQILAERNKALEKREQALLEQLSYNEKQNHPVVRTNPRLPPTPERSGKTYFLG